MPDNRVDRVASVQFVSRQNCDNVPKISRRGFLKEGTDGGLRPSNM